MNMNMIMNNNTMNNMIIRILASPLHGRTATSMDSDRHQRQHQQYYHEQNH